ncbi:hypothetical protein [Pseudomonas aeruginosa]|uniref:hypothetical protein n=1 Tax=Pseudomonas aeruginosa TaxID=287 RepID=UPI00383B8D01
MLKEEQVRALLMECEHLVGQSLIQIRGNLTKSENRSAAIFELLAIQAFSALGKVEYEPFPNSPDIRLTLPDGTQAWVEVAFLYDKYWKQERQSRELTMAMRDHARTQGVEPEKISLRFNGVATTAGYDRHLPELHEFKKFLKEDYVKAIFDRIQADPLQPFTVAHPVFSFEASYVPSATYASGGGLVQEAPKDARQHQLFKIIKRKASQHSVEGFRIVCVGTDTSRALSRSSAPAVVTAEQAARTAFNETTSVGCVITVDIKHVYQPFSQLRKLAHPWMYANPRAKAPLTEGMAEALTQLDFNRWKFSFELNQYQTPSKGLARKLLGSIRMTTRNQGMSLEIPSALLVEVLAGRGKLLEGESGMDSALQHFLSGDYRVENCSLIPADVQAGEGAKVKLDFVLDHDAIFERLSKP